MLLKFPTAKSVSDAASALQVAVQANEFGVMQIHNLRESMAKKGVPFKHDCLIFEVCQPQLAKQVLEGNMDVSTALPCRISVYEEKGKTFLAAMKPTAMLALFNLRHLDPVAEEAEKTIRKIMIEAAS